MLRSGFKTPFRTILPVRKVLKQRLIRRFARAAWPPWIPPRRDLTAHVRVPLRARSLPAHDFKVCSENFSIGTLQGGYGDFSCALTALEIFGDGYPGRRLSVFDVQTLPGAIALRTFGAWCVCLRSWWMGREFFRLIPPLALYAAQIKDLSGPPVIIP